MVRTKETNAADPDEQKATQGIAEEGVSLIETKAEQELHEVVSTMLEIMLMGNVKHPREWIGLSEKARHGCGSEKEMPGTSLADGWLAEPEWVGESSEAKAETAAGSREPEE